MTDDTPTLPRESCICGDVGMTALIGAWTTRCTEVISERLSGGETVDQPLLRETVKLIAALSKGARRAYAPASHKYYHHLPDCPFDKLGPKQPLCKPAPCVT